MDNLVLVTDLNTLSHGEILCIKKDGLYFTKYFLIEKKDCGLVCKNYKTFRTFTPPFEVYRYNGDITKIKHGIRNSRKPKSNKKQKNILELDV